MDRKIKSMMFNCGNPREPKGTQGNPGDPKGTQGNLSWWPLTNDVNENDVNEKKGALTSKNGTNPFPKNWDRILRPAINEWRPKNHPCDSETNINLKVIKKSNQMIIHCYVAIYFLISNYLKKLNIIICYYVGMY